MSLTQTWLGRVTSSPASKLGHRHRPAKVVRLLLERRAEFSLFGGVRFGGTVTLDNAWALGFDHVALAMGAGMLPIALGFGADGSFRTPLGVSVIGGLITSTLLSLVVIPAAYSMVAEITERYLHPLRDRLFHRASTSEPVA